MPVREHLARRRAGERAEECLGRLDPAPGAHERLGVAHDVLLAIGRVLREQGQRAPIEARGVIEREGALGALGRRDRVLRGALGEAGGLVVEEQRLGIGLALRLERGGDAVVVRALRVRCERRDDRLANPVVEALEHVVALAPRGANELRAVQPTEDRLGLARLDLRRHAHDRSLDGRARDREHLEHPPLVGAEAREALFEDRAEPDCLRVGARRERVLHELTEEERAPARLGGDGRDHRALDGAAECRRCELDRLVGRERLESDARDGVPRGLGVLAAREQTVERRAAPHVLVAEGDDDEHRRRGVAAHEIAEQREAFVVCPLEVVEEEHDGVAARGPREQLAERGERARSEALRVDGLERATRRLRDRRDAIEHGEDARQRRRVDREHGRRFLGRRLHEVARERVDRAVERLVRNRFALVAAPGEHDAARGPHDVVDERAHHRALADARRTAHERRDRLGAIGRAPERVAQVLARVAASDEQRALGRRLDPQRARRARSRAVRAQHVEDGLRRGARVRSAREHRRAERFELGRSARPGAARRRRVLLLLLREDRERRAVERQATGERLEQHHADRVPVGRARHLGLHRLLGRHVRGRSREAHARRRRRRAGHRAREPEVDEHRAPARVDEHVRRLHVAMDDAGGVERGDAGGELPRARVEAIDVEPPCAGRNPRDVERRRRARVERRRRRSDGGVRVPAHVREPVDALDELHREEPVVAVRPEVVELHEVRVVHVGERAELRLEAVERRRVEAREELQRDVRSTFAVEHLVDRAEAPFAERANEVVPLRSGKASQQGTR